MPIEKPKDKGEVGNRVSIMLGLVDRSAEVVVGGTRDRTVGREETGRISAVQRGPFGQWGDARYANNVRGVPWQPNLAEVAGERGRIGR